MRINITGGVLEAELQDNPIEKIQSQLEQVIQRQDEDSQVMGSHVNESISQIHNALRQLSGSVSQDIQSLESDLNIAVQQLLANDQNNPAIMALNEKLKKLSQAIRTKDDKIKSLIKVHVVKPVVKPDVNPVKNDGIRELNSTIRRVTRKQVPASRYLGKLPSMKEENKVRQTISRAGVSPHSSDSNMQDKLNAQPRMPI